MNHPVTAIYDKSWKAKCNEDKRRLQARLMAWWINIVNKLVNEWDKIMQAGP